MKKQFTKNIFIAAGFLAAFAAWTVLLYFVDIRAIGPRGSSVGFATLNAHVHEFTGVHMWLYTLTDWLGLVPIATALGFAVLGLVQWIKRRNIFKVDCDILILGVFYIAVIAVYLLFEVLTVNYRPVLINGCLEASYPSSTTILVLCVMPTAIMQLVARIKSRLWGRWVASIIAGFTLFMVIGRFVSGVHWASDIIGGLLLSAGLVMIYPTACGLIKK